MTRKSIAEVAPNGPGLAGWAGSGGRFNATRQGCIAPQSGIYEPLAPEVGLARSGNPP
jgi:hypothetical protein